MLGQSDFVYNTTGTIDGAGLSRPADIARDAATGRIYAADADNNRVLWWDNAEALASGEPADGVLGQVNFSTGAANRGGIPGVGTLNAPQGVTVDGDGNLWVADTGNHRVLRFDAPVTGGMEAALVVGQQFFWVNRPNDSNGDNVTDSAQARTLNAPHGLSADDDGHLWVADTGNHRVLRFDPPFTSGMSAGLVLGQADFLASAANRSQPNPSDATMNLPEGVFVTRDGFVWVADSGNHRVLRFHDPSMDGTEADMLLGQILYSSGTANRNSTVAADTLSHPSRAALDAAGSLLVTDTGNHRVLKYFIALSVGMPAEGVVGQANPVSGNPNWGGTPAANTLSGPVGVMTDRSGFVWAADSGNNRVLRYSSAVVTGCSADLVLGQADFTHNGSDFLDGRTVTPRSAAVDPASGRLYAADPGNNRVLWWDSLDRFANGKNADGVLGQPDLYSNAANRGGTVKANTLRAPSGVAVDGQGNLWVADRDNHRVLRYAAPVTGGMDAGLALGQADLTSGTAATAQNRMSSPNFVRVDPAGNLWVADTGNNRVLKFSEPATGANAALELGQANFGAGNANRGLGAPAANTLSGPCGIAVDSGGNVFVADRDNHRVLYFSTPAANGVNADRVFGKAVFTNGGAPGGAASNTLNAPAGVELDAAGTLWVADSACHRVLGYRAPFTTNMAARQVLGQASFTSGTANRGAPVAADGLSSPSDVRTDAAGNLWITDTGNNRLVEYNAFLITSVTPQRGANTGPVAVTALAGQEFLPGYVVRLQNGTTEVVATQVNAPETGKLSCVFDLTGAATGLWTIAVSTGPAAGAFSCALADGFTVAPLSVSSVSPARGDNDRTTLVTLSGEGFVAGTQVRLTRAGYAPIAAASAAVADGGTLRCAFDLAGAATGYWDLAVATNSFTHTSASGFRIRYPVDCSQAVDPAGDASVVLKAEAGNITVDVPDGAFSGPVALTVALAETPAVTRETLRPTALCMDITNDRSLQPLKDLTLTIRYRDSDVAGLDETKLTVCRYDAARGHWAVIPSTPVPAENRVTASVNHLSRFAVLQVAAAATVNDVGVYPNPYSPVRHASGMVFESLPPTAEIRIYTLLGEFIGRVPYESRDGRAFWYGKNEAGNTVASGVYIALIQSPAGTKRVKLAVEK